MTATRTVTTTHNLLRDVLHVRVDRADLASTVDAAVAVHYWVASVGGARVVGTDKRHLADATPYEAIAFSPAWRAEAALEAAGYRVTSATEINTAA